MKKLIVKVNRNKCVNCGFCKTISKCYSPHECTGCLACYWACPYEARSVEYIDEELSFVNIYVDNVKYKVPNNITVKEALKYVGFSYSEPGTKGVSSPCNLGGCWACALIINGSLERTCITPVKENMRIHTNVEGKEPLRIVHGPEPHIVGGKATPWLEVNYRSYVEAAIWVAGCNLRCPQCQNYHVTYDNITNPITPKEAARRVIICHKIYGTKGIAVSGGEPTLNRRWLIEFFKEVTKSVKPKVRRHLDSNGTILKQDYIDELIEAGCNNIGIEPKCVRPETYMRITGINERHLAIKYLETSWKAIEYINERYIDKVYLGIGLIYNKALITYDEIAEAGEKIASINPKIQVTVLDYFPSFRRKDISRPSVNEMLTVKKILEDQGLQTVIVQTEIGHFGPNCK